VLPAGGAVFVRVEVDAGEPVPKERFDAIVAMGGPMSVNDEADLPWLIAEKALIAESVRAGTPFWGVCLGVQLLASSLGARVWAGDEPEVGVLPVDLTDEALADPVFAGLPRSLPALQWHGDTFDLPEGAVRLAGSIAYPNQAFRFLNAYGLQFHLEVSTAMALEWAEVPEYDAALRRVLGPDGTETIVRLVEERAGEMLQLGRTLFERFVDNVILTSIPSDLLEV
jgi:GMP synthase-like glutamine amidotransferase